jgi:hypothetical protein
MKWDRLMGLSIGWLVAGIWLRARDARPYGRSMLLACVRSLNPPHIPDSNKSSISPAKIS